jgi:hypothetical protein
MTRYDAVTLGSINLLKSRRGYRIHFYSVKCHGSTQELR